MAYHLFMFNGKERNSSERSIILSVLRNAHFVSMKYLNAVLVIFSFALSLTHTPTHTHTLTNTKSNCCFLTRTRYPYLFYLFIISKHIFMQNTSRVFFSFSASFTQFIFSFSYDLLRHHTHSLK